LDKKKGREEREEDFGFKKVEVKNGEKGGYKEALSEVREKELMAEKKEEKKEELKEEKGEKGEGEDMDLDKLAELKRKIQEKKKQRSYY
jgi:hypothetical protein